MTSKEAIIELLAVTVFIVVFIGFMLADGLLRI